jgi:hypothetical protein
MKTVTFIISRQVILYFHLRRKEFQMNFYDIDKKLIAHSKSLSYNRGSAGGVVTAKGLRRGMDTGKRNLNILAIKKEILFQRIIINIPLYLNTKMEEYLKEQGVTLYHLRALVVSIKVLSILVDSHILQRII